MANQRKDGQHISCYLDRNLYNRLCYYADEKGQTKTLAIERILKEYFDKEGVPAVVEFAVTCGGEPVLSFIKELGKDTEGKQTKE